ncbi:Retrovirus-related Pol polyprotein from transposon RE1 [Linum perenne]
MTIKLTPTNYLLWKAQLQPLLHCYDFMGHIDGSKPAPLQLDDATNPVFASWFSPDQLVLSWITLSFIEAVMPQLIISILPMMHRLILL